MDDVRKDLEEARKELLTALEALEEYEKRLKLLQDENKEG